MLPDLEKYKCEVIFGVENGAAWMGTVGVVVLKLLSELRTIYYSTESDLIRVSRKGLILVV